jgi:hypothetical protein
MRNRTVLMIMAITTVAALGLLVSSFANAEQSTTGSVFSLLSTSAAASPLAFMLVKGNMGSGQSSHHMGMSMKGGMNHGRHYRHYGYWPNYYNNYDYSCYTCYWDGYQRVCYNACDYDDY